MTPAMQARFRLRCPAAFARLREQGRTWHHPFVLLSVAPNNLDHNRYGVIASRRLGNAVKRNRARRLMREALRQHHPHIRPGHDIALIARAGIAGQHFVVVKEAVQRLLKEARLLSIPEKPTTEVQGI